MSRLDTLCAADRAPGELRHALPRLVVGLSLATFGILYTLDNVGVVDVRAWAPYWPALVVLFGGAQMAAARRRSDLLLGGFWALIGTVLLLGHLHLLPIRVWDLWPLVLVAFGLRLVTRSLAPGAPRAAAALGVGEEDDGSTVHALAVMSGVQRRTTSVAFRGGSLTAIMGGIEVDLSATRMVAERAFIDCFAFWGGIEITVPPGWVVRVRALPLMGGVGAKITPPAPGEASGELVVTGWAIMGGIVVKQQ